MRYRFKFDKKGIPAFILILFMLFRLDPSEDAVTVLDKPDEPLTLALVDGERELIGYFRDGVILTAADLPEKLNVVAALEETRVAGVQFLLDDVVLTLDEEPPFSLASEEIGWELPELGEHTITAIPLADIESKAVAAGGPLTVTFSVAAE